MMSQRRISEYARNAKKMSVNVESGRESAHGKAVCWAARIVSLVVALPCAVWMFYLPIYWTTHGDDPMPLLLPLDLIPLVLGLISWRRHLVGGTLLGAFGILLLVVGINSRTEEGPNHDFLFLTPIGAALLIGGMLHIMAWVKESRGKRAQNHTWSAPALPPRT